MRHISNPGALCGISLGDQDYFKQLFDLSPDPAWIIDGNRFIECNEAALKTLGYPDRFELLNLHPSKLSPPRQADGEDSYAKAERMKSCVRETDTVARHGGDEFVVMVGDLTGNKVESSAQARSIAEKIRSALAKPYALTVKHKGQAEATVEYQCTASIGVVVFIAGQGSQEDFLRWADSAMYQAKDAGSNLIRFYEAMGQA